MSDRIEQASALHDQEQRLRAGLRWLVWGSLVALLALTTWAILAAANGSAAGMVAASSGSIAVVLGWTTGYTAFTSRLKQIAGTGAVPPR